MKISIVSGSHRHNSQSSKVARHIERSLKDNGLCEATYTLNLAGNPLPFWYQGIWDAGSESLPLLEPISKELSESDAFVIVSPEWHGQVPAGLKNFFLLWGKGELAHKPALIVTVSAGDGGAYPVAELRMSSYKNNRICYIPEQIIVRHVEKVLNDDPAQNDESADGYFRGRILYALKLLKEYAVALRQVRTSGAGDRSVYKNGM